MKKRSKDKKAVRKLVKGLVSDKFPKKKIGFASSSKVDEYGAEVDILMSAIGIEPLILTNFSTVGDFDMAIDDLGDLSKEIGVKLSWSDPVWKVGKRIREKTSQN